MSPPPLLVKLLVRLLLRFLNDNAPTGIKSIMEIIFEKGNRKDILLKLEHSSEARNSTRAFSFFMKRLHTRILVQFLMKLWPKPVEAHS